jgi:hypothetical protein
MGLLKKQEEERASRRIEAEEAAERLAAKDQSSFTRLIDKNIILVKAGQETAGELGLSKR